MFYLFALKIKENSERGKVKYLWKIIEWSTFAEIILASSKCFNLEFFCEMLINMQLFTSIQSQLWSDMM